MLTRGRRHRHGCVAPACGSSFRLRRALWQPSFRRHGKTNVPPQEQAPDAHTRLPHANVDPLGPRRSEPAPEEGAEAPDRSAAIEVRGRRVASRSVFPRSHRLTRGNDLNAVRRTGARLRVPHLDVRSVRSPAGLAYARVGFVVPKYAHSAVDRNRLKRRLRELTRTRLLPGLPPVDLVIRALPSAYEASFATLTHAIARVAEHLCGGC